MFINPIFKKISVILFAITGVFLLTSFYLQNQLLETYNKGGSTKVYDRNGREIFILQNQKGNYSRYIDEIPSQFKDLLLKKEDRYFYYHFGFNPWSLFEATLGRLGLSKREASSTITQQLVKILLEKESERNIKNKIIESFYALALEVFQSKEKILKMYANSIYFGNQAQGISEASRLYFDADPALLTDAQILQLLATISSPTQNNPAENNNKDISLVLADRLELNAQNIDITNPDKVKENIRNNPRLSDSSFELQTYIDKTNYRPEYHLTVDEEITKNIRDIVKRNVDELKIKNANNAAVVVIKLPENEMLSLIGSPNPLSTEEGYKINMLSEPRSIGSTIKPFIYLNAFEKGLRPYTLVNDREYKYITAIGFPLYPKNFDYKYRGEVTLHYALSNSLNVPAVKVLEYVGLEDFYKFLEQDLNFKPIQDLHNYQLGIALGALEMNLLDLSHYFTIFPNKGILKELKIDKKNNPASDKKIADEKYIQLINKILNDRRTGIEQFGLKSELNLFQENYALKTGTSRDYKDSWVIGYTPDFLVGVWVGNADSSPTEEVSGQIGAGAIWSETMNLLLNSEYNKKTAFKFNLLKDFDSEENIEYGLEGDDYETIKTALIKNDSSIILNPHDGDSFILENNTQIIFQAKEKVKWYLNSELFGEDEKIIFSPLKAGQYKITAQTSKGQKEMIYIFLTESF